MNKKLNYEAPEMSIVAIQPQGIINSSARQTNMPDMNTLSAQEEDWGSWQ